MEPDTKFELLVERLESAVEKRPSADPVGRVVSIVQLVVLIAGIAGIFLVAGRRDQQLTTVTEHVQKQDAALDSLRAITADLARTTASNSSVLAERSTRLQAIEGRLRQLERDMDSK